MNKRASPKELAAAYAHKSYPDSYYNSETGEITWLSGDPDVKRAYRVVAKAAYLAGFEAGKSTETDPSQLEFKTYP